MSLEKAKSIVKPPDVIPTSETAPPRKGKAYVFIKTDRGLFPLETLKRFEMKKAKTPEARAASKQLKEVKQYVTDKNLIPHPFEVLGLLVLMENCSFFDACVRQIAKDVIGQGWSLNLREDVKAENEALLKEVKDFFLDPNTDEDSIEDVYERAIIDWGVIGWWGIEVVRDKSGKINGLYHVPAHTLWVHRDGEKYCQIRDYTNYVWFKRFGYEEDVSAETGEEGKNIPEEKRATELIFYRNYSARSSWYGAPNILPGVGSIKALIGIRDYNLAFFENYGVPAAIVTVTGEWEEDSVKLLSDFIDVEIKGSGNAHKTVVLNPPIGGEVKWEPLITEVKEGHFKLYHQSLRDEVLVCYKMPPYRIGLALSGSLGGSTAAEMTPIYVESVINPLKRVSAHQLTEKIVHNGFEDEVHIFRWGNLDTRDINREVTRLKDLFGMGVVTRKTIAKELGYTEPADPDAEKFYIAQGFTPVGEQAAVTMSEKVDSAVLDLNKMVEEVLKSERAKKPRG